MNISLSIRTASFASRKIPSESMLSSNNNGQWPGARDGAERAGARCPGEEERERRWRRRAERPGRGAGTEASAVALWYGTAAAAGHRW